MGGYRQVSGRGDDHVDMARAIGMTSHLAQHASDRPVGRHRIERGPDGTKPVAPFGVGADLAARLHAGLLRQLHVVVTITVTRPDVEQRVLERPSIGAEYAPGVERRLALDALGKIAAAG